MKWLSDNANWLFSGVGIVLFTGLGFLAKKLLAKDSQGQQQKADRGSVAIQAGRDVQVGHRKDTNP